MLEAVHGALGNTAISPAYPTRQPRHHQHLPPGHRQQRDHQHGAWTAVADNFGQRRPSDEAIERTVAGSAWRPSADPLSHPRLAKCETSSAGAALTCFRRRDTHVGTATCAASRTEPSCWNRWLPPGRLRSLGLRHPDRHRSGDRIVCSPRPCGPSATATRRWSVAARCSSPASPASVQSTHDHFEKIASGSTALTMYCPASTISEILRSTARLQSK